MKKSQQDRRNYYRVEARAILRIYPDQNPKRPDENSVWAIMRRQLAQMDTEFTHLSGLLYDRDNKTVLAALKLLNRKIDLLSRTLAVNEMHLSQCPAVAVNLSEGGLAWCSEVSLPVGETRTLDLILLPEFIGFHLSGIIQECLPENGQYRIHLRFKALNEADRQLLARLVLQYQQQARQTQDDSTD